MASVTLFVNPERIDKHGRVAICVQITHNRKTKRKTLFSIDPKFWDEKKMRVKFSHENNVRFNEKIIVTMSILEMAVLNLTPSDIVDIDSLLFQPVEIKEVKPILSLIDYLKKYEERIRNTASIGYLDMIDVLIRKIQAFGFIPQVDEVSEAWVKRFADFCKVSGVTFSGYLKKMRSALKLAINDDIKVDRFIFDFTVKKKKKIKRKLNLDQIKALIEMPISNVVKLQKARDFFLMQMYMLGMRAGDLMTLRYEHIINGRVDKSQNKTDNDLSIKIIPQAQEIIDRYKNNTFGYVMPYMKLQPLESIFDKSPYSVNAYKRKLHHQKKERLREINEYLKIVAQMIGFEYSLSSNIARHSVAVLAKHLGLSDDQIAGFLGHGDKNTTKIYMAEIMETDELDDAAAIMFDAMHKK